MADHQRHVRLLLRCSVHGQTRRSGRLVRDSARVVCRRRPAPPHDCRGGAAVGAREPGHAAVVLDAADVCAALERAGGSGGGGARDDDFSRRYLRDPGYVVMYYPTRFDQKRETEGEGAALPSVQANQAETRRLNSPTTWNELGPDGPVSVGLGDATLADLDTLGLDIRFIPRRVVEAAAAAAATGSAVAGASPGAPPSPTAATATATTMSTTASGFFGVALVAGTGGDGGANYDPHLGTLWRSSYQLGAAFISIVGGKGFSRKRLSADTSTCWASVPAFSFKDFDTLVASAPYNCPIVAIAPGGVPLTEFQHPPRALYVVADTDAGLGADVLHRCPYRVSVAPRATPIVPIAPEEGENTAAADAAADAAATMSSIVAASLVLYDRCVRPAAAPAQVSSSSSSSFFSSSSSSASSSSASSSSSAPRPGAPPSRKRKQPPSATSRALDATSGHLRIIVRLSNRDFHSRVVSHLCRQHGLELEHSEKKKVLLFFAIAGDDGSDDAAITARRDTVMAELADEVYSRRGIVSVFYCSRVYAPRDDGGQVLCDVARALSGAIGRRSPDAYRVNGYPSKDVQAVCKGLSAGVRLDPKAFARVAFVVTSVSGCVLLGECPARCNFNSGPGFARFAALCAETHISRAYWKLEEAAHMHDDVDDDDENGGGGGGSFQRMMVLPRQEDPRGGLVAINFHASPGGWAEFLVRRCARVVAVDARDMDPTLLAASAVGHQQARCQVRQVQMDIDSATLGGVKTSPLATALTWADDARRRPADVCVSDGCCDANQAVRLIHRVAPLMRPGATLVLTMVGITGDDGRSAFYARCNDVLARMQGKKLFANRKQEWTFFAVFR